jgi:hypothetical protein
MAPPLRPDPRPLVAGALALAATALYLWLVQQKGDGRFEPEPWFVALALLGTVEAGLGAFVPPPRQRIVLGSAAVTLLVTAALTPQTMQTSHGWALLGAVALPLLGAGAVCALGAWRPVRLLPVALAAVLLLAVALASAGYLASHGEGVG